jgi:hypothetical protein
MPKNISGKSLFSKSDFAEYISDKKAFTSNQNKKA